MKTFNPGKFYYLFLLPFFLTGLICPLFAQKTKTLNIVGDRGQSYMTTKVYELKHVNAANIQPMVEGAVVRNNRGARTNVLSYRKGDKEFIVVSMAREMVPYIDDMIKKLDRPGKKDASGSEISGTGITHGYYKPKYHSSRAMIRMLNAMSEHEGRYFLDPRTNLIYWKDSKSNSEEAMKLLKQLDRPVPQVTLKVTVYEAADSDLKELGVDFSAMKKHAFAVGNKGFKAGVVLDSTFIRALQKKNKLRAKSKATIVVNNLRSRLNPARHVNVQQQNLNMSLGTLQLSLRNPLVTYADDEGEKLLLNTSYTLSATRGRGTISGSAINIQSTFSVETGSEKLIAVYRKDGSTTQNALGEKTIGTQAKNSRSYFVIAETFAGLMKQEDDSKLDKELRKMEKMLKEQ